MFSRFTRALFYVLQHFLGSICTTLICLHLCSARVLKMALLPFLSLVTPTLGSSILFGTETLPDEPSVYVTLKDTAAI